MRDDIFVKVINKSDDSRQYIKLSSIDIFREGSDGWIFVVNDISYHSHTNDIQLYKIKASNGKISFELLDAVLCKR